MGNQLRTEMATKGKAMKAEYTNRLLDLKRTFAEAELLVSERDEIKKEAEAAESAALEVYREAQEAEKRVRTEQEAQNNAKEAEDIFKKYDSNQNGLLEVSEIQTRIAFDKNRDGEVNVEEAKYFLDDQEHVDFETFKTLSWPRVKPFLMLDSGLFKPPAVIEDLPSVNKELELNDVQEDEESHHSEDDDGAEELDHLEDGNEDEEYEEETGEGEVS